MTREKDRWNATFQGTRSHPDRIVLISRLHKDWDRFVEIELQPDEARDLAETLTRFGNDRIQQAAD
jgi:23S rRNA A2030 N6-methylase RlmJ